MKTNLWINEVWINATRQYKTGESEPYETFTDNIGELFNHLKKEYGKCVSNMYVDKKSGETVQTGWVFEKKMKYTDADEYYTAQTWITVYKSEPVKTCTVKCEYAF